MALKAKEDGVRALYLPAQNAKEASIVDGLQVYPVEDIAELCACLQGEREIAPMPFDPMLLLAGATTFWRTWPTCEDSPLPSAHWRLRRRAGTTCC